MSDRFSYAENYYKNLLTGQFGLAEVISATKSTTMRVNKAPAFTFFLDRVKHDKVIIATNGVISSIKTLAWVGILWVSSSAMALDDARFQAYPIIGKIRGLLDGSVVDYSNDVDLSQEMVEAAYTTNEGPLLLDVGKYAWGLQWEFGMQFTSGVQV